MQNNKKTLTPPSDFSARAKTTIVLVPGQDGAMNAVFVPSEGGTVVLPDGKTAFVFPENSP
jgi:hypothetical protein